MSRQVAVEQGDRLSENITELTLLSCGIDVD